MTLSDLISGIFAFVVLVVMALAVMAFFRLLVSLFGGLAGGGAGGDAKKVGEGVGAALHGAGRMVGAAGEGIGKGAGALAGGAGRGIGAIVKPLVPSASGIVTVGKAITSGTGKALGKLRSGVKRASKAAWDRSGKHAVSYAKRKYKARQARKEADKQLQKEIDDVLKEADQLANQADQDKNANPFSATGIRWRFNSEEDAKRVGKILLNGGVVFGYDQSKDGLYLVMPQTQTAQASQVLADAGVKAVEAGQPCDWLGDDQIVTEVTNDDGTPYLLPDEQAKADAEALAQAEALAEAQEAEKVRKMKEEIDRKEAERIAKEKAKEARDGQQE